MESSEDNGKSRWRSLLSKRSTLVFLISAGAIIYVIAASLPISADADQISLLGIVVLKAIGVAFAVTGLSVIALNYLGTSVSSDSKIMLRELETDPTNKDKKIEREYVFQNAAGLQTATIVNAIRGVKSGGAETPLKDARSLDPESCIAFYRFALEANKARLTTEIGALGRRGNLNLVIGSVTTVFSIGFLAYIVLTAGAVFANLTALLSHYIPRITTVIFIEVFSFFFLRLYRSALSDIKYYQNELTALASMSIAVEVALAAKDPKAVSEVIGVIAKSNFNTVTTSLDGDKPVIAVKDVTALLERFAKVVLHGKTEKDSE